MRIIIADAEEMFREVMQRVCSMEFGHEVVNVVGDGEKAAHSAKAFRPDVLLMDLSLPKLDGFEVVAAVRDACPLTKIIAISSLCGSYTLFRVERAGFDGYIHKGSNSISAIRHALAAAAQGQRYFSPTFHEVKQARLRDPQSFDKVLSNREIEVLALIGFAMSDQEIGEQLHISTRTAETFRHRILKKLNVPGTPKLIRRAIELGFTQVPACLA